MMCLADLVTLANCIPMTSSKKTTTNALSLVLSWAQCMLWYSKYQLSSLTSGLNLKFNDACCSFQFQLSLVPQGSDAAMDTDKMGGDDPEVMQKVMAEMKSALLVEAEKNKALTQRLIAQAEEAHRMNII